MIIKNTNEPPAWSEAPACPHLGMDGDPSTSLAYPSTMNLCYQCRSLDVVRLDHQRKYCLVDSHRLCPLFATESLPSLPDDLRMQLTSPRSLKITHLVIAVIALSVISVVVALWQSGYLFSSTSDPGPQSPVTIPAGYFPVKPALHTPSLVVSIPATLELATFTPWAKDPTTLVTATRLVAVQALDQPFGSARRFIIHRMLQGESLFTLATRYNTSAEAIKNINRNMPDPIWVEWPVVIPLDTTDVSGLPAFEAYQEMEGEVSLEQLAGKLNLDLSSLVFYNDLQADHTISKGEWLLLPPTLD